MSDQVDTILPIVFSSLYMNSKSHWNTTIHGLIYNTTKMFRDVAPKLFESLVDEAKKKSISAEKKIHSDQWEMLENAISCKKESFGFETGNIDMVMNPTDKMRSSMRKKSVLPVNEDVIEAISRHSSPSQSTSNLNLTSSLE